MSYNSENLIDYSDLQRSISIILSGITVIPIFYICKKFFNNYYSLIGATIFALEPRIIINSIIGISEPLYILAISLGILFFLNLNKKIIYLAFGFFAWATIIRPEGQFWFIAFSITYLVHFRKKRKDLIMFLICLAVFLLVLSPIVIHRVECCESDMIFDRIIGEIKNNFPEEPIEQIENITYGPNWINGIKLFGWSLIPVFIIFVPIGLIPIFKQLKYPNYLLVLVPTVLAIPIMYSVSIAPDTRYVYPLFPIFCVISLFGIKWIVSNFDNKKLILGIIIFGIIMSSIIFLDFKKIDYTYDEKSYEISKLVIKDIKGVNDNSIAAKFFKLIEIENGGPIIESAGQISERKKINQIYAKPFTSLDEYIEFGKKEGLTHLVIDNNYNMQDFFIDVYDNEEKYQYLLKEYDSEEHGYNYHVKKFKINYEYFNEK
jgi:4-amino-4-deoxy-L-arabinose transferase-like glycosyltransferase